MRSIGPLPLRGGAKMPIPPNQLTNINRQNKKNNGVNAWMYGLLLLRR